MGVLYPNRSQTTYLTCIVVVNVFDSIISLGVGWLALLILRKGQCEGLSIGIGTEDLTPTSFFISHLN